MKDAMFVGLMAWAACMGALCSTAAGCGSHGMAPESAKDVENAVRTSAMVDRYRDAGDPASDLNVATHCALQAVVRNEHLAPFDSGIPCP